MSAEFKPTHPEYRGDRQDRFLTERDKEQGKYIQIRCKCCGVYDVNAYTSDVAKKMAERQLCFYCNHAEDMAEYLEVHHKNATIIDGRVYTPGNRTTGEWRGMAGRRFDIEYLENSAFAGKRCTTHDLWSGTSLREYHRERFPDTARFLNGAGEAQVGEITCWNDSRRGTEPYPLPRDIGLK